MYLHKAAHMLVVV